MNRENQIFEFGRFRLDAAEYLLFREEELLGIAMAEALISKRDTVPQLVVRPVGMVRRYAGSDHDSLAAGLGQAVLVADPAEKAKRWKAEWSGAYKDRETDYLLIKVKPRAPGAA